VLVRKNREADIVEGAATVIKGVDTVARLGAGDFFGKVALLTGRAERLEATGA